MKIYTKEMIKEKNEKKRKRKKISKIFFSIIWIIFLAICIYIACQKFVFKSSNIELFGYKAYVVLTGSMKPTINPNDIVIVKKTSKDNIKENDIITFSKGSTTTVTHRIIEIVEQDGETLYRTKGDNNNSEDVDLVKYNDIEGVYKYKLNKIGAIITGSLTGTGMIGIFLILAISYHRSSKKEDRILTREEARKRYNIYKYNDKEDTNDTI